MRPSGRRQPKESFIPPPPQTPIELPYRPYPRDSDASFASSRPSSAGGGGGRYTVNVDLYKERSFQLSAVSTINAYLASLSFPVSFKSTCPSAKDILETLKFLMSRLDLPTSKVVDELPILLRHLNYPYKFNKSLLKSPAAPHQWPAFLALIHWLVQIAKCTDHDAWLLDSSSSAADNVLFSYTQDSYMHYIAGNDDAVDELDRACHEKLEREKINEVERLKAAEENMAKLEAELEGLKSMPSQKEVLEKEKSLLEEDVIKFHKMIEEFTVRIEELEKVLSEKEKRLEAKVEETKRINEENEELKKRVELQTFNTRDVERMRRELQAVDRDIAEAELARNAWEERSWDLHTTLQHKFKDLEAQALDCNQAIRRSKIRNDFQYQLDPKGSTLAEIMGVDHKTLKSELKSRADDLKRRYMENSEQKIILQETSSSQAARVEGKRNDIAALQSLIDDMESQLNTVKKETLDNTYSCAAEAKKLKEDVQLEAHEIEIMEREAAEVLKASKSNLQEAIKHGEEEIQTHASELLMLVDSVSKFKEHSEAKISEMRSALSETAVAVSNTYRGCLPKNLN